MMFLEMRMKIKIRMHAFFEQIQSLKKGMILPVQSLNIKEGENYRRPNGIIPVT